MTSDDSLNMLEDEGVPDHLGPLESKVRTGDPQEGIAPPGDRPVASVDFGTTVRETREGEPLDGRLARELPDPVLDLDDRLRDGPAATAGRLVEDDEGARSDAVAEAVAVDVGYDSGGFSAEEAAVHVVDEDHADLTDDPDGYVSG